MNCSDCSAIFNSDSAENFGLQKAFAGGQLDGIRSVIRLPEYVEAVLRPEDGE